MGIVKCIGLERQDFFDLISEHTNGNLAGINVSKRWALWVAWMKYHKTKDRAYAILSSLRYLFTTVRTAVVMSEFETVILQRTTKKDATGGKKRGHVDEEGGGGDQETACQNYKITPRAPSPIFECKIFCYLSTCTISVQTMLSSLVQFLLGYFFTNIFAHVNNNLTWLSPSRLQNTIPRKYEGKSWFIHWVHAYQAVKIGYILANLSVFTWQNGYHIT